MSWSFIFLQFYHVLPVVKPSPCNTKHRKLRWIQHSFGSIPVAGEPQNVHPIPCRNRGWSERSPLARDFVMRLLRLIFENVFFFHVEPRRKDANQQKLGGGFKYFFFHPYLGKIPNLTNIFQRGWNHQLVVYHGLPSLKLTVRPWRQAGPQKEKHPTHDPAHTIHVWHISLHENHKNQVFMQVYKWELSKRSMKGVSFA